MYETIEPGYLRWRLSMNNSLESGGFALSAGHLLQPLTDLRHRRRCWHKKIIKFFFSKNQNS